MKVFRHAGRDIESVVGKLKSLDFGRCMALERRELQRGDPLSEPVGQPSRSNEGAMQREN